MCLDVFSLHLCLGIYSSKSALAGNNSQNVSKLAIFKYSKRILFAELKIYHFSNFI